MIRTFKNIIPAIASVPSKTRACQTANTAVVHILFSSPATQSDIEAELLVFHFAPFLGKSNEISIYVYACHKWRKLSRCALGGGRLCIYRSPDDCIEANGETLGRPREDRESDIRSGGHDSKLIFVSLSLYLHCVQTAQTNFV